MNINFEKVEKAWFKPKNRTYWQNKCFERSCEVKLLKEKINKLEEWLIKSYEYMSYTPVNEILRNPSDKNEEYGFFYNLNSIHDKAIYNEKVRKKIQELKKEMR